MLNKTFDLEAKIAEMQRVKRELGLSLLKSGADERTIIAVTFDFVLVMMTAIMKDEDILNAVKLYLPYAREAAESALASIPPTPVEFAKVVAGKKIVVH